MAAVGDRLELGGHIHEDLPDVGRLVSGDALRVGPGEQQQIGDQAAHALGGAKRRVRGLPLLAVEHVGKELEVREDARERRAQLVRGVGDELALALEHVLGLELRGLERLEHVVERSRELGDFVVGPRLRYLLAGVARAGDVTCRGGQPSDRLHRAAGQQQPCDQRQQCPADNAQHQEEPDAVDGALDVGDLARVLHDDGYGERPWATAKRHGAGTSLDAVRADVIGAPEGGRNAEVWCVLGLIEDPAGERQDADLGVAGGAVGVEVGVVEDGLALRRGEVQPVGEVRHRRGDLVVEVRADPVDRQLTDGDREPQQDHERQRRGDQRQAPADRDRVKHGARIRRRGSCAGAAARLWTRACGAGSRRRPRSCSLSRTGRSPRPLRGGAGAARRSARCA